MSIFDELHPIGGAAQAAAKVASDLEKMNKLAPPVSSLEMDMIKREASRIEDKILRQSSLHDSPTREKAMGLQQDSKEYKEFLRMIECLAEADDWAHYKHYKRFYRDNEDRQEMLLLAIFQEKIKYKFRKKHWGTYGDIDNIDDQKNIIQHCLNGQLSGVDKEWKEAFEFSFYDDGFPNPLLLKADSFLAWLKKEYPYTGEEQIKPAETIEEKTSDLSLIDILNLLTPEMYSDELKGRKRSAITKSVNTLKDQMPKAFKLCCSLVMEAMPCDGRKEHLKYTRNDVINKAKEKGVKSPMAIQIHQELPAVMKK
ncbi:MAG: hypothetical protein D3924_08310 [Candidatus Electrothrix sp. AR4]|nr:hypothetical protein [Candidatus Electrothrix sp. AR4]